MKLKLMPLILLSFFLVGFNNKLRINVKADDIIFSLNELLDEYRHNGTYKKETIINLNEDSIHELSSYFHAGSTLMKRTTYYQKDSLWMSNGNGKYSYYGTNENGDLTNGTVDRVGKKVDTIAIKGVSMEEHYYTLNDIIASEKHNWEYNNNVYFSSSKEVVEWFKGFTAPCYLGFNKTTSNYIIFDGVEVEKTINGLELRLLASSTNEAQLNDNSKNVFSKAIITYSHEKGKINDLNPTSNTESGYINYECSICRNEVIETLDIIQGQEVEYYLSITNADIAIYQGNIYTYGGSPDGINRTDAVYCYNTYSNKIYELDVKINLPSTSHRVLVYNDKAYIFGGLNGVRYDTIQIHDFKNNTLEVMEKRLPFGANCFQVGMYKNKAYFLAGSITGGSTAKIHSFDFETFEVEELNANMPTNVFKGGWCTIDQYAYVIGGTNGQRLNSVFRFNMETFEVETMKAKLPYNLSQVRLAYDNDNHIYIYGGTIDGNIEQDTIFAYDLDNDIISELDYKLPYNIANTCVANINNIIYILGGNNRDKNIILAHKNNEIEILKK